MGRGRKAGTALSREHREKLSAAAKKYFKDHEPTTKLEKNKQSFIGPPKPPYLLSPEGYEKRVLAARKAAVTKQLALAEAFTKQALETGSWISADRIKTEDGIYVRLQHKCGTNIEVQWQTARKHSIGDSLCKTCNPIFKGSSKLEDELFEFCKTLEPTIIRHYKKVLSGGKEVDLADQKRKLAIELNGLFWHSEENGFTKTRHLEKTNKLEEQGWRLIQIFEDELLLKPEIVKSRLKAIFSKSDRRVFARQCVLDSVPAAEAEKFFNETHIQGWAQSSVRLGLRTKTGELIACMSFGKPRFNKKHSWELIRFSTSLNTTVVGGASKLFKAFLKSHSGSIISYADRRWSSGGLYRALGFAELQSTEPAYFYFKGDLRKSRFTFQKKKLTSFENFSIDKTEQQIMAEAGWRRIWDCGNRVFVFSSKDTDEAEAKLTYNS